MADDIVERLCDWQAIVDESKGEAVVAMLSGRVFGEAADEIERLRAEVTRLMDGLEYAWVVITNGRAWDEAQHDEWEQAKVYFRDEHWHPALDRNKEARRG